VGIGARLGLMTELGLMTAELGLMTERAAIGGSALIRRCSKYAWNHVPEGIVSR
jgi:hypothetical protein